MKYEVLKSLSILALFSAGFIAFAEEAAVAEKVPVESETKSEKLILTVDDAVKMALENNKSLKSAAIDLEIKRRADKNSWNTFLPKVSASLTAARQSSIASTLQSINGSATTLASFMNSGTYTPVTVYEDEEKLHWATVGNVGVSWGFNAAMITQIKLAKTQYEAGLISFDKSCDEMETNIRKLFYGLLIQQENLKINKDSLENARARYDQASINYRNGLVPELQVLNAQVTYENAKPNVLKAETGLEQNYETFAFLLGLPYGTKIELDGKIDIDYVNVDADELCKRYVETSNEISSLKKTIEAAEFGLRAKKLSAYTPSLAVNYSYQPTFYAMGESVDLDKDNDSGSLSFTIAFSNLFSFLPWSSDAQGIKDIKQQIAQAELGYEQLVQNSEVEIHKLVDNLEIAKVNLQAMQKTVELAQKAYSSTLKGWNNGTQEWLSVRESDASLKQARLGLMNERYNYFSAVLDLEQKLNFKITD